MKNLVKVFSILLISLMVIMFCTNVLAADSTNNGFSDLTSTLTGGNNTNTNNTNTNNTNTKNTNNTNTNLYNNSGLPKTGIEASVPVAMLIVIFGISSVYAYKKVKDYKNL